jgi:hypothetical protein
MQNGKGKVKAAASGVNPTAQAVRNPKPQKTKNEYMRIGVLVLIIVGLAVISSFYIDLHKGCSGVLYATQRNNCFERYAVSTGNTSMCYEITGTQMQNLCLEDVAVSTRNASICNSINNQSTLYSCASNLSISTGNESVCNSLNAQQYKSECLYSFASLRKFASASYCNGISNHTLNGYCSNASTYTLAMSTGNASYCSNMSSNVSTGMPATELLSIYASNSSATNYALDNILLNASDSEICYYSLAIKYDNPSLCAYIPGTISAACAIQANSTSVQRAKLSVNAVISNCTAAGVYGGELTTDSCYVGFAVLYHNATYCSPITNSSVQKNCIARVANGTNSSG